MNSVKSLIGVLTISNELKALMLKLMISFFILPNVAAEFCFWRNKGPFDISKQGSIFVFRNSFFIFVKNPFVLKHSIIRVK